jgi:hypothetical protein
MQTFTLPRLVSRERQIERIAAFLSGLAAGKGWTVEVKELVRTRSGQQNRYLWGVAYPAILQHLPGWTADDLHEYCLGECFGWEVIEGFGRKRMRPLKRSSKLSTTEFTDFVADIQMRMAERGIYVPDADELQEAA